DHEREVQRRIFVSFGRTYHEAVGDSCEPKLQGGVVTQATGSLGSRLTQMHSWLYGPSHNQTPAHYRLVKDKVRLRGIEIILDPIRVIEVARNAVEQHGNVNNIGRGWYVTIDERKVSMKWLVSVLTGLPVSAFHTDEARRVLSQLGMDIHLNVSN